MFRFKFNCKIVEKELFFIFNLKNTFSHKTYSLATESYGLIEFRRAVWVLTCIVGSSVPVANKERLLNVGNREENNRITVNMEISENIVLCLWDCFCWSGLVEVWDSFVRVQVILTDSLTFYYLNLLVLCHRF